MAKQISAQKTELAERHVLRLEFWGQLLDKAKSRTPLHADKSPAIGPWLGASAGLNGLFYAYAIRRDNARIELYIDQGDHEDNKRAFDTLYAHKDQIEKAFQHPLDWQRSDNQRSCRIRYLVSHRGLADQEHWPHLQEQMIDAMVQLSQAFQAEIQGLKHTD